MMDRRTEYTVFHMKQSFIINIFWFFGPFIPILWGIMILVAIVHAVFLAWKAYSGEKFVVSYIYPYSENLIGALGIGSWFTPKK